MEVLAHLRDGAFSTLMSKGCQGDTHVCLIRGLVIPSSLKKLTSSETQLIPSSWGGKKNNKTLANILLFMPVVPDLFGTRDLLHGRQFFHGHGGRVVSGLFKPIIFFVYFISIIIIKALPQIIKQ